MGGLFGGLIFSKCARSFTAGDERFIRALARGCGSEGKASKARWFIVARLQEAWATSRKNLPAVNVAAAGGWSDIGTLLSVISRPIVILSWK